MIGAGQLARMTCQAAPSLGIAFRVLAAAADESAAQVTAAWLPEALTSCAVAPVTVSPQAFSQPLTPALCSAVGPNSAAYWAGVR